MEVFVRYGDLSFACDTHARSPFQYEYYHSEDYPIAEVPATMPNLFRLSLRNIVGRVGYIALVKHRFVYRRAAPLGMSNVFSEA